MSRYVLIGSRDPFDSRDCERLYEMAEGLTHNGNQVTLFLVQNGVLPLRRESAHAGRLRELARSKVSILADSFSLRERAIGEGDLVACAKRSDENELVDSMMAGGTKAIWH